MQKRVALILASLVLIAGCSSTSPSSYPIAAGTLKGDEVPMAGYGTIGLASRVFDVVNQDQASASNTGIAGSVQPTPADILSNYAAQKFRANGGPYTTRFVIKQASLAVRSVANATSSGWFDTDSDSKAELTVDLNVMVVATKPDGTGATINATTTQSQQAGFGGTPEEHRVVYVQLMGRALAAVDAEISRQLPSYFSSVMAR
jgi:hypothetical protein